VRKASDVSSFYPIYEKNEILKETSRCVSFIDFCHKSLKLPRLSDTYDAKWKEGNALIKGLLLCLME